MKKEIVYNKLVRDLIPNIITNTGSIGVFHKATEEEYKKSLLNKLLEEAGEFVEEPCEDEIGDILEVIDALISVYGYSHDSIVKKKYEKAQKRGKFNDGIILEKVIKER